MDPDALWEKSHTTVRRWLTYGNAITLVREWKQAEAEFHAERETSRMLRN